MRHLYSSAVRVEVMKLQQVDGMAVVDWGLLDEPGAEWVKCRLDLNFLRPGKDAPAPVNAGVVPDRIGIMFCAADAPLRPGCRIVTIPNEAGKEPVKGIFEIKSIPDVALDYSNAHHIEVQITEAVHTIDTGGDFGEEPTP